MYFFKLYTDCYLKFHQQKSCQLYYNVTSLPELLTIVIRTVHYSGMFSSTSLRTNIPNDYRTCVMDSLATESDTLSTSILSDTNLSSRSCYVFRNL